MGQYWVPVVEIEQDKKYYTLNPHQFDNGYKFMEHSYIGNEVPSVIMNLIYNNPYKVSWVGDYCEDLHIGKSDNSPIGSKFWDSEQMDKHSLIELACKKAKPKYMEFPNSKYEVISDEEFDEIMEKFSPTKIKNYILVNHDQKIYLSFEEYVKYPKHQYSYYNNPVWENNTFIHPLCVLTAAPSMDFGGGDYHERNATNWDKVGTWSWDTISVEDKDNVPDGFEKVAIDKYYFDEIDVNKMEEEQKNASKK